MAIANALLTAEEFLNLPDDGQVYELVRGCVVMMVRPGYRHGRVCNLVGHVLRNFVAEQDLGEVISNDAGVITERNPDTVRGPDVTFYSYARVPRGADPVGYPAAPPEIVFEVLSPHDRWPAVLGKAAEYLDAGVLVVCILDPELRTATICRANQAPAALAADDELLLPELHAEFRLPLARFFG
jgi:Uma2 family endonuclease